MAKSLLGFLNKVLLVAGSGRGPSVPGRPAEGRTHGVYKAAAAH